MSANPNSGGINVEGDVSGTIVYGDNNRVTTTRPADPPARARNRQHSSAEDNGTVYSVTEGTMHVTVNQDGSRSGPAREDESSSD